MDPLRAHKDPETKTRLTPMKGDFPDPVSSVEPGAERGAGGLAWERHRPGGVGPPYPSMRLRRPARRVLPPSAA
jgi:hypothetical protein